RRRPPAAAEDLHDRRRDVEQAVVGEVEGGAVVGVERGPHVEPGDVVGAEEEPVDGAGGDGSLEPVALEGAARRPEDEPGAVRSRAGGDRGLQVDVVVELVDQLGHGRPSPDGCGWCPVLSGRGPPRGPAPNLYRPTTP